jgi:RNA polymerase sigma-70 factor (ECF subfamily)
VDVVEADDAAAIEAASAGDHAAFGALVERYQQAAFRAAYLIVRDAQEAEDVAQEAFVRAYRRLHTFRRDDPFRPWLLRIVQNQALNAVRSRTRRGGLLGRIALFAPRAADPPDQRVAAADESSQVLAAINELPPDDRIILHLRYFLDLPEREIAAAIGRPAGTVKSRLHRAGQRLRSIIEKDYPHLRESIGDG